MEKFVCFLMCLAAVISVGSALKCYTCDSDKPDGCIKSSSLKDATCGAPTTGFQSVCVYTSFHDAANKKDKVSSSCQLIAATAPLSKESIPDCKTPPVGMEVKECRVCNQDLCNSSSIVGTSMITLLCLPLMYLVSKLVLS